MVMLWRHVIMQYRLIQLLVHMISHRFPIPQQNPRRQIYLKKHWVVLFCLPSNIYLLVFSFACFYCEFQWTTELTVSLHAVYILILVDSYKCSSSRVGPNPPNLSIVKQCIHSVTMMVKYCLCFVYLVGKPNRIKLKIEKEVILLSQVGISLYLISIPLKRDNFHVVKRYYLIITRKLTRFNDETNCYSEITMSLRDTYCLLPENKLLITFKWEN